MQRYTIFFITVNALHIPNAVRTVFELLMMGGDIAWNTYSIDSKKEYCITLHLVGYTL